jgi:hypothetical protein
LRLFIGDNQGRRDRSRRRSGCLGTDVLFRPIGLSFQDRPFSKNGVVRVHAERHEAAARSADERALELQVDGVPTKIHNVVNVKGNLLRLISRKDPLGDVVLVGILSLGKITGLRNNVSLDDNVLCNLKLDFMDFAIRTGSPNANIFQSR